MRMQTPDESFLRILPRTGDIHLGIHRVLPGLRPSKVISLCKICSCMMSNNWLRIDLCEDWRLCTVLRTHSGALYYCTRLDKACWSAEKPHKKLAEMQKMSFWINHFILLFQSMLYVTVDDKSNSTDFYLIRRIPVLNLQSLHGTYHRVHRHEDILVDKFDETSPVFVRVTTAVNYSHLFDECALARLTGSWSEHTHNTFQW